MLAKLSHNENLIWALLLLITLFTWLLVEDDMARAGLIVLVALSSLKVYLIGVCFMEIFAANKVFKIFYHAWVSIVMLMIVGFSLFGD